LAGLFQRDVCRRRDNQVEVVRHNHELMQKVAALTTIVLHNVKKQVCHFLFLKKRTPSVRDGRDEKRSDFLWSVFHFPPAPKRIILDDLYAALKGPLFHRDFKMNGALWTNLRFALEHSGFFAL
jgi:hypothetical protein